MKPTVLVLGGGPDAEREVSLESSRCVAEAIASGSRFHAHRAIIGRITPAELRDLPGEIIFPVLHGAFGEGGPLQDMLVADGRPFVGCGPSAARLAMDKIATKLIAASLGIPTAPAAVLGPADEACPFPLPVVVKPVHEGSSVGVHICRTPAQWTTARRAALDDMHRPEGRAAMVEPAVLGGGELTVGILDAKALAPILIKPAVDFYDYQAKYHREDTQYVTDPALPPGVSAAIRGHAEKLARGLGVRHLCRVDFLLDASGAPWLLEVNTMPGFTTHSLLPKAAAHAGMPFTALTEALVDFARRDHAPSR